MDARGLSVVNVGQVLFIDLRVYPDRREISQTIDPFARFHHLTLHRHLLDHDASGGRAVKIGAARFAGLRELGDNVGRYVEKFEALERGAGERAAGRTFGTQRHEIVELGVVKIR